VRIWNIFPTVRGNDDDSRASDSDHFLGGYLHDWVRTPDMISSVAFSGDGHLVCAGLFHGSVLFYSYSGQGNLQGLKFFTQIDCRNKNGKYSNGTKVRGLEFLTIGRESQSAAASSPIPSASHGKEEILLVTTNDDRVRICNIDDFGVICKLKGASNHNSLIKASFSADGKYVIMGSDDGKIYMWDRVTSGGRSRNKIEKNGSYEVLSQLFGGSTTVALFAPAAAVGKATQINPGIYILDYIPFLSSRIIVSAGEKGRIMVYSRYVCISPPQLFNLTLK
jgi:WD40 repeat protein